MTKGHVARGVLIGAALLLIAGCASWGEPKEVAAESKRLSGCLGTRGNELNDIDRLDDERLVSTRVLDRVDTFLNCYIGPHLKEGATLADGIRELRGHIIATVATRYAAFNFTGAVGPEINLDFPPYDDMEEDAALTVLAIGRVERGYRRASGLFEFEDEANESATTFLPNVEETRRSFERLKRATLLFRVLREAAGPTYKRGKLRIAELLKTFRTPTPGGIKDSLKGIVEGTKKLAVLDAFAIAYRTDIRGYLDCVQEKRQSGSVDGPVAPGLCKDTLEEEWQEWDGALEEACDRLSSVGGIENVCLPGTYR